MSKNLSTFTFLYTSDRIDAYGVRMYTDKSSEVCTLRFDNTFTLPVATPQDLIDLAHEILSFARDAYDFHYPELLEDETPSVKDIDKVPTEPYAPVEQEPSKVGKMMMGTVSALEWNPNDPSNW